MSQAYIDPEREDDPYALPDVTVTRDMSGLAGVASWLAATLLCAIRRVLHVGHGGACLVDVVEGGALAGRSPAGG